MGWFFRKKNEPPVPVQKEDIWTICSKCGAHVYKAEWEKNLWVCPTCGFHERISAQQRLHILIDAKTFQEFDDDIVPKDPLGFADGKGTYPEKVAADTEKTGLKEAVVTGTGRLHRIPVVIAIMDFRFFGGSLSGGVGDKILLAADYARRHRRPFIVVSASGGARMQEGVVSLMQMAKTCAGIARLHEGRIPYISVLTDPTYGGVSASYAMVGDMNIAEPGALIGFAGRRVIEQTIKQQLPEDFQTAEYLLAHGVIDAIVKRMEMKAFLSKALKYWRRR